MKNLITFTIPVLLGLFLTISTNSFAQDGRYALADTSKLIVKGTSTLHDWEADAQKFDLNMTINRSALMGQATEDETGMSKLFPTLTVAVPVKELESGKGKMDKKMHGALNEKDHPEITFELSTADLVPVDTLKSEDSFLLKATGLLTIAGISRQIEMNVVGQPMGSEAYRFTGSYSLNMKDYNVDPPSVMFGTIKAGEEVDIEFDLVVTPVTTTSSK